MDENTNITSIRKSSYLQRNLSSCNEIHSGDSYPVHDKKRCTENIENSIPSSSSCARFRTAEQIRLGSLQNQMTVVNNVESTNLCENSISNNRKQKCRDTSVCTSSSKKRREDVQQKEQEGVANVKAQVKEIVNDVEIMLATYTSQVDRLQTKYLETDAFVMQDIADIMFIINCVLSNLMKELTEKQHYLAAYCASWNDLQKQNDIRPELLHIRRNDDNDLQSENEDYPESRRCAEIDSANAYTQQSREVMQQFREENHSANGTMLSVHADASNDKIGSLPMEVIEIMDDDHQINHTDELQSNKYIKERNEAALPSVGRISTRNLTEAHSMNNGTVESEDAGLKMCDKLTKQFRKVSYSLKENPPQSVEQLNDDSDLWSTCSTIHLQPVIHVEADNKERKYTRKKKKVRTHTFAPAVLIELSDTNEEARSSSCSSDETYFSPRHKNSTSNKQDTKKESETRSRPVIRTRRILRKNEIPFKKGRFKSVVPDITALRRKYYFEAARDKNTKYSIGKPRSDIDLPKKGSRKFTQKKLFDYEIALKRMDK